RTSVLADHGEHHAATEVEDLLDLELQVFEHTEPLRDTLANRRAPRERIAPHPAFPDRIRGEEADHRVKVPAIGSLQHLARTLDQVGGRGLLRHRPLSIPLAIQIRYAALTNTLSRCRSQMSYKSYRRRPFRVRRRRP